MHPSEMPRIHKAKVLKPFSLYEEPKAVGDIVDVDPVSLRNLEEDGRLERVKGDEPETDRAFGDSKGAANLRKR